MGIYVSIIVSKLDQQTIISELNSHWVLHTSGTSKLNLVNNYFIENILYSLT